MAIGQGHAFDGLFVLDKPATIMEVKRAIGSLQEREYDRPVVLTALNLISKTKE